MTLPKKRSRMRRRGQVGAFETEILGVEVTVESIDLTGDNDIVAVCRRGGGDGNRVWSVPLGRADPRNDPRL
jgi:hypothetical protein